MKIQLMSRPVWRRLPALIATLVLAVTATRSAAAEAKPKFDLRDGDRVVLIGDTLIEREGNYGYVETRLTARYATNNLVFRNLGWSADTPQGQSRVSFDWNKPADEWFKQLMAQVAAVKPTVAIIGYGMANSFDGEAGLPAFKGQLTRLIEAIQAVDPKQPVRFLLLSPIPHEPMGAPLPDPKKHNQQLELYTKAIEEIATQREFAFVNLYKALQSIPRGREPKKLTDNGIHLSEYGYWRLAETIEMELGFAPTDWQISITTEGQVREGSYGSQVTDITRREDYIKLTSLDQTLVMPTPPGYVGRWPVASPVPRFQFRDLKPGLYEFRADGTVFDRAFAEDFDRVGRVVFDGPQYAQAEKLRQAIVKKNELFFYRWRPQNQTYLFGFRKHEQGQNAKEIPMFDPLIAEQEAQINQLKKPVAHTFELVRVGEDKPFPEKMQFIPLQHRDALAARAKAYNTKVSSPVPPLKSQPTPEFEVAPGFEVKLFAENPHLAKPIQMNFDPKGRLWIASSAIYPQIQPGQVADDKILVVEDTDGDGVADKSTVFADGLLIPTGVEPGDGGVYVGQSTELLHFKDTDGDGKADQKRVVLSGFGTEDTHHILHTLRWGHDGQLYMNQSIYIHTHAETPHGVTRLNSGGVLALRPPTMELGIFLKGFCNPWGHHFDEYGQSFVTDGAGFQGINHGVQGATYFTYAAMRRELPSISPGNYPKFCGLEVISSEQFPADWQGSVITADFRAHRIVRFAITEQGSTFAAKEMPDLLRTTNVTFRPIDVKLGPDGALYIADWSNPIIQHGEVDFRDPRRDHEHGRVWRVSRKDQPLVQKTDLTKLANTNLLDLLIQPNGFRKQQARRVLTERPAKSVLADLNVWKEKHTEEKSLLEALWIYQSFNQVEPALLRKLLTAKDANVRSAATRVLAYWQDRMAGPLDSLAQLVADENPRVRLEALRALARVPSARAAEIALSVLDKPLDSFLDYALWLTINDLADPWIQAVQSGAWKIAGHEKQFEFALKALEPGKASLVLGQYLKTTPVGRDGQGPGIELIGSAGGAGELRALFDQAKGGQLDDTATARALIALGSATRLRNTRPTGDLAGVRDLFAHGNAAVSAAALRLAGAWKLGALTAPVVAAAANPATAPEARQAAFDSLREIGGNEAYQGLAPLTAKENPLTVRQPAALALAAINLGQAAPKVVEVLSAITDENEALALWRSLLNLKGSAPVLTRALPRTGLPVTTAKAGVRAARESGRNDPELILALTQGANLEKEEQNLDDQALKALAARALKEGDPARGEAVYRRAQLSCVNCHAIGGAGGKVGPDLTSIGASAPADYLIESLLYPSRKIKEGYHAIVVETKDDQELSGVLVRENNEQLVIRDAGNREVSVAKNNVAKRQTGGSLMPSGLLDGMSEGDRLDLYRFLSELGKRGPYDASQGSVARLWRLRPGVHTTEQFGADKFLAGDLKGNEWTPVLTYVDGRLSEEKLTEALNVHKYVGLVGLYAAARFQSAGAGNANLKLTAAPALGAWIDGQAIKLEDLAKTKLTAGNHTLIVKLDPKKLPETLRVESTDVTFLAD